MKRVVATVALVLAGLVGAAQAQAATFTVGSTADTGGCAKPPTGTTCTLRQLVNSVPAGSTIAVPAASYTLTAGELLIDQNLTITGAGARTTSVEQNPPAGTPTARVLNIEKDPTTGAAPTVTISGLDIFFGKAKGRYAAATTRGTIWSVADRCDGTTKVSKDSVLVNDFVRHITITVRAGHSYLALARPPRHK